MSDRTLWMCCAGVVLSGSCGVQSLPGQDTLRFGRDVLPILSANCFACHGPDASKREAELRLDDEADAKASHATGIPIVPGNIDASTLLQRISSRDPDLVMPPPDSHKELKPVQKDILRRWIAAGAEWGRHWSFEPIVRPEIADAGVASPIDSLVSAVLAKEGLELRPTATPHQLVRRLALDLTGVPPATEVADRFAADPGPAAYEKLVDELLASPRFGEHWARMWMDLARYADTKGYEKDLGRTMWPYRDWLVRAINEDRSLERMTIEQLAGDLLPDATIEQQIATAFHRNTMSNDEGGTDDEEFRTIAVKDRVDTTMQVWMGLTAGCAKCHSHKYDPISQSEYYGLYAILNQTQDADRYDDAPTLEVSTPDLDEERRQLERKLADLRARRSAAEATTDAEHGPWRFGHMTEPRSANGAELRLAEDGTIVAEGVLPPEDVYTLLLSVEPGVHTVLRLDALTGLFQDGQSGVGRNPRDPNFVLSELEVELLNGAEPQRLSLTAVKADFSQAGWPVEAALDGDLKTGWAISPQQRERHTAVFGFAEPLHLDLAAQLRITMRQQYGDSLTLKRIRLATSDQPAESLELPQPSAEERNLTAELAAVGKERQDLQNRIPKVPVMQVMDADQQRVTRIHRRGNFLDPGDEVAADLPVAFHQPPGEPVNRLVLARWLMSPDNPLTARVWVNRIQARLQGIGLVETEEDFGALGSLPSHPELLDWLAAEYRYGGWSLKKLLKSIVMSRTYRQSSETTPELRERDPRNVLLSRGGRYRLPAEVVRDQALAVSGLLSSKMGGPPVMPPQPDGLWRSTYNGQKWVNAEGEDRFRRALYTYLKRTTPYPSMTTFDGGSGEVCQIRRIRTNTPLQALVTLNDPVFVEAAGALAMRMLDVPGEPGTRASEGLRRALIRPVHDDEVQPLVKLLQDAVREFQSDPGQAESLLRAARVERPDGVSDADVAGWIVVANTILNLDEFLTRN